MSCVTVDPFIAYMHFGVCNRIERFHTAQLHSAHRFIHSSLHRIAFTELTKENKLL